MKNPPEPTNKSPRASGNQQTRQQRAELEREWQIRQAWQDHKYPPAPPIADDRAFT
jgi:hypothetical protein